MERLVNGTPVYTSKVHRFGTDAILLSHFCNLHRKQRAIDLCSGCGIVPLWFADNGQGAHLAALEIDETACELLRTAIKNGAAVTPHVNKIEVINADLRTYKSESQYDLVSCNPPYFTGGFISDSAAKAAARHTLSCTTRDVMEAAARLLKNGGDFCLCQKPENLAEVFYEARRAALEPKVLRFVSAKPGRTPWLCLIRCRKGAATGLRLMPQLFVEDEHGNKTQELLAIYGKRG